MATLSYADAARTAMTPTPSTNDDAFQTCVANHDVMTDAQRLETIASISAEALASIDAADDDHPLAFALARVLNLADPPAEVEIDVVDPAEEEGWTTGPCESDEEAYATWCDAHPSRAAASVATEESEAATPEEATPAAERVAEAAAGDDDDEATPEAPPTVKKAAPRDASLVLRDLSVGCGGRPGRRSARLRFSSEASGRKSSVGSASGRKASVDKENAANRKSSVDKENAANRKSSEGKTSAPAARGSVREGAVAEVAGAEAGRVERRRRGGALAAATMRARRRRRTVDARFLERSSSSPVEVPEARRTFPVEDAPVEAVEAVAPAPAEAVVDAAAAARVDAAVEGAAALAGAPGAPGVGFCAVAVARRRRSRAARPGPRRRRVAGAPDAPLSAVPDIVVLAGPDGDAFAYGAATTGDASLAALASHALDHLDADGAGDDDDDEPAPRTPTRRRRAPSTGASRRSAGAEARPRRFLAALLADGAIGAAVDDAGGWICVERAADVFAATAHGEAAPERRVSSRPSTPALRVPRGAVRGPVERAAVSRRARAAARHRAMAALAEKPNVMVKVGMVGDSQVGKTTMMVKYVENRLDDEYIQTLGVNFMEKSITLRNTEITFSIWDLGGHREFLSMLPLVCNDAAAVLFMFDLSRKSTLTSIKEWYRQVRGLNRSAFALLVGTKYDVFVTLPPEEQAEIDRNARKFAKAMKAPCIFTSAHESINVQKMFKVILSRVFDLKCTLEKLVEVGEPLLIF
ncbi:hypothetical protein JL722_1541 [Aureococcus anophagefferens]|nr:hypothetical protein JL722_1541 [Aureococcus anophagefferens]